VGAALRQEPRLAARLRALVVMGGRLGPEAGRGEHNVNADPEATRLVLESGARLRLGTYEVTMQARMGRPAVERLRQTGDEACRAAAGMLELYLRQVQRADTAMYDPPTLTLAHSEAFLSMRAARLRATYGEQLVSLEAEAGGPVTAEVSVACAADAFMEYLLQTVCH
jgi:inosine-uridine nucleoside N-ribohydrolase